MKDRISVQPADPDLAALLAADSWRAARVHARPATATWCPLIRFAESTKALGVTKAGPWWWGVEREDGWEIYPLEGDAVVGILPQLEMPFGALEHKARHSAIRLGIPPQRLLRTLPRSPRLSGPPWRPDPTTGYAWLSSGWRTVISRRNFRMRLGPQPLRFGLSNHCGTVCDGWASSDL